MFIDPIYGRDTLVDLDGELCVLHEVPLSNEPKIIRFWYPTGQRTAGIRSSYGNIVGALLKPASLSEHGYHFASGDLPHVTVNLKDRGRTVAIKVEEINAVQPSPKRVRGKRLYWHNGQWFRDLATGPQALGVEI